MIRVVGVVGARPNFMKLGPVARAMRDAGGFDHFLVHTGQHYDQAMSEVFLHDLGLAPPDASLGIGSGTHAEQTARIMLALEPILLEQRPDLVMVVGDVNSTLAGALTAAKLNIPVAHVEAGLRSFDRTMPEEVNRVLTDTLSELLFAPSSDGVDNLLREGVPAEHIHLVGNVMIDSMLACAERAEASSVLEELDLEPGGYVVATLHRPSNVDRPEDLERALEILGRAAELRRTVLVAHPRTVERLELFGLRPMLAGSGVIVTPALGYLDFLRLMGKAAAVLTDSGGIQEETTVLGTPCITLRDTTERPVTVTEGTNQVTGMDPDRAIAALRVALERGAKPRMPALWDGHAAERIVRVLQEWGG